MSRLLHVLQELGANRHGGSAIEFALVAPIFLTCAFALFQVGFGIYSQATLAQIAHEGARHLLFSPEDEAGARDVMMDALHGTALDTGRLDISAQTLTSPYHHIKLTVDYRYQPFGPIPLPEEMVLSSAAYIPLPTP